MSNDNESQKTPSEILGYYYIMFEATFTGFVKCWMDGSENYKYLSTDEFLNLFKKLNVPFEVLYKVDEYINTSGIYMWDLNNSRITKLTPQSGKDEYIGEAINKMNPFYIRDSKKSFFSK